MKAEGRRVAFAAARIETLGPEGVLTGHAVLVAGDRIEALLPVSEVPGSVDVVDLGDVDLAPGFVDVQVNGGGGELFNDSPEPSTLARIASAHRRFGTTALLPTFITDSVGAMRSAREAVNEALRSGIPGVLGIHFEGPFLDPRKTGAHDRRHVRGATEEDLAVMVDGALGTTVVTAAAVQLDHRTRLRLLAEGVRLCLGHCASTFDEARAHFAAGVTGVTHLFNAMSPMESRAPGLVGAALATKGVTSGLILDGIHVDYGAARVAWRAAGTQGIMLVTDAVHPVGTDMTSFSLGGQSVRLEDGACINEEGNLAGSALDMASAVRNAVRHMGAPLQDALRMASSVPARFLGLQDHMGAIAPGMRADFVALDAQLEVKCTVVGGEPDRN